MSDSRVRSHVNIIYFISFILFIYFFYIFYCPIIHLPVIIWVTITAVTTTKAYDSMKSTPHDFCELHETGLLVSYLKSVRALKMKLVAPMPEQIGTTTTLFQNSDDTTRENALLGCQFVLTWLQRNSIFGSPYIDYITNG